MPERSIDTAFWNDPAILPLSPDAKLLFLYSWTNIHCTAAGVYEISLQTISFETGLSEASVKELLLQLQPKVKWFDDYNILWMKSFLKRQSRSPKFLIAAAKSLVNLPEEVVSEVISYNQQRYRVSIPYRYPIDTLSIPPSRACANADADANASSKEKGGSGGEKNGGEIKGNPKLDEILAKNSTFYEANIGMISPMIAEKLKDISDHYPLGWFEEAVNLAVTHNVRKLSYVESILKRWEIEGYKTPRRSGPARPGRVPTGEEIKEQFRRYGIGQQNDNTGDI